MLGLSSRDIPIILQTLTKSSYYKNVYFKISCNNNYSLFRIYSLVFLTRDTLATT